MLLFHYLIIYPLSKQISIIMPSPLVNHSFLTQEIDSNPITDEDGHDRPKNYHITTGINSVTQDPETICVHHTNSSARSQAKLLPPSCAINNFTLGVHELTCGYFTNEHGQTVLVRAQCDDLMLQELSVPTATEQEAFSTKRCHYSATFCSDRMQL